MDVSKKPMGIYTQYLLGRTGGAFSLELKVKVEKEKMVLTREYAELINSDWQNKGRFCEYHEDLTVEYYTRAEEARKAKEEADELEEIGTEALKEVVKVVKQTRKPRAKKTTTRKKSTPKTDGADDISIS